MEEEKEEPSQEEDRVKNEEPKRIAPSLLEVELDELGLKDGEILSFGEALSESESELVITRRKFEPAPVYFDLSVLRLATFPQFFLEFLSSALL